MSNALNLYYWIRQALFNIDCAYNTMSEDEILIRLKRAHENAVIFLGVGIGVVLLGYFFTYAMLTDKGNATVLWFEGISTVVMAWILIKIKYFALLLIRMRFYFNADCKRILKQLTVENF